MAKRKTGGSRAISAFGRALGFIVLALVFAGSAFLLTCQRNPRGTGGENYRSSTTKTGQVARTGQLEGARRPVVRGADSSGQTGDHPQEGSPGMSETHRGPMSLPSASGRIRFGEIARGSANSPKIALTFDAGADPAPTGEILGALAKHHVHATFFLTGRWVEKNPELVRRIVAGGHEIGNHTYSHKRLTQMDAAEIADEIEKTDRLVMDLTGKSTKPLLRVPYGNRDDRVLEELQRLGYRSIYWQVDSWDAVRADYTSADIENRVLGMAGNGSIVLMHCGSKATADALDSMLQKLIAKGYQQVTVGELLGIQ